MTARGTWKRRERDVAKALNGQRIPVTGVDRHGADVTTPLFAVQVKHGRRRPKHLRDWLEGICSTAKAEQVGIVIWADNQERLDDAVVLMRMKDFRDLHGKPEGE
jgi:hypothetical protein